MIGQTVPEIQKRHLCNTCNSRKVRIFLPPRTHMFTSFWCSELLGSFSVESVVKYSVFFETSVGSVNRINRLIEQFIFG